MLFEAFQKHIRLAQKHITHILISLQQKLEHGPKILPNIDEADGIAMCHLQKPIFVLQVTDWLLIIERKNKSI